MSHLLPSAEVTVQELHQLARIETVLLTQVDEQAAHTLFGLPAASAAFTSLSSFLASLPRRGRFLYLRRIGIVGEELSELDADNLLDNVFLVDIFEVAADVLHERSNLLLLHVGLDNLVHHLVELLLANLLGLGYFLLDKLLANLFLDAAYLVLLARVDDADARALLAGASGAARAVGVVLDVFGQTEVDDVRQVVDVQSACCHVGGHEQLRQVLAELLHREVALLLREVAVQGLGVVAVLDELVGYLLRLYLRAAEDDGKDARVVVDDTLQRQVFILGVDHIIDMVDVLGTLVS